MAEAVALEKAGVDVIVAQGAEAGARWALLQFLMKLVWLA